MNKHNHKKCIRDSMANAQASAEDAGKKLTPQRLQVLQILLNDHKALGAYDILEQMREQLVVGQSKPQPPTVYRALDFLLELSLIHKVESQNSYYACTVDVGHDGEHIAQAFICEQCGRVEEKVATRDAAALFSKADGFGFKIKQVIMECRGLCATCNV